MSMRILSCFALILFGSWLSGCDNAPDIQASGKVYNIAFMGEEQGDGNALEGVLAANAAEPLLDNGDRLEIVRVHHASAGKEIPEALKVHVKGGEISAILLGGNSKTILQLKHEIDAFQIPALALKATHPEVTEEVEYISQLSFDDERQAQAAALFMRDELSLNRAAVLFSDIDPHSAYLGQVFRTTFEVAGGEVDEFTIFSQLNQAMLQRLKDKDTQIIYMPLEPDQVFHVLEQLSKLNWKPVIMAADGLHSGVIQAYSQRLHELNGMYVTDLYSNSDDFVSVAEFVKKVAGLHDEMFNDSASTNTALGVEGYQVIKYAMNRCPDRNNSACINKEIRSIKNQQGVISRFSILANGKAVRPIYINTLQDGKLELVVKVN